MSGGSVAQPMSRLENWRVMLISALNSVEVEVEAELGKNTTTRELGKENGEIVKLLKSEKEEEDE